MHTKQNSIITGSLMTITALSTAILTLPSVSADDSFIDVVNVTVPVSCSLAASGMDTHTASIQNGVTTENIGTTNIKATCNDNTGYALYAIGYTNDEYGNNKLTSATLDSTYDILTSTSTSNTSSWAMKLTKTTNDYTPIISGSLDDNNKQTGDPDFSDYSAVPNEYTKVAYALSSTDMGANASGSNLTTTYRAYISQTQPAGTYVGQVKYTLVHPNTAGAPLVCNPTGTTIGTNTSTDIKCMQDISSTNKSAILSSMTQNTQYTLADSRDEKNYAVAKLADGNIWMLDNLALDPTDTTTAANMSTSNTNATTEAITNYLNGGNTNTAGWSSTAVVNSASAFNSHTAPMINNASVDTLVTSYGLAAVNGQAKVGIYYNYCAATVGTYCYAWAFAEDNPDTIIDAPQDICPAGWRMPTGGDAGEYNTLYGYYNTTQVATNSASLQYNLSTPLSGSFAGSSADYQGDRGEWWSSTYYGGECDCMYSLYINPTYAETSDCSRNEGLPVRCVAR